MHIESLSDKIMASLSYIMFLYYILIVLIKIVFPVHLKHSSLGPSADAKPVSYDLVLAMPWQCVLALYVCDRISMV